MKPPARRKKKGRNLAGGYETLPSGLIRYKRSIDGRVQKGPARETRADALKAWEDRHSRKPEGTTDVPFALYVWQLCNRETGELIAEQEATTVALLRSIYNHHIRDYPDAAKPIGAWDVRMAREWCRTRAVQPRTLSRYVSALRGVFRRAIIDGHATHDPFAKVALPRFETESEKIVLRPRDQRELLTLLDGRTRDAAILWLHGLRRGEAAGLRFEDFDGEGVLVRRTVNETDQGVIVKESTKNRRRRWVPLNADGIELLSRRESGWVLPRQNQRRGKDGKRIASDTAVIIERYGEMCSRPHNIYRALVEALKGTPYEGTHPHDYRSSATNDMMRVADLRTAAEIAGHAPEVLVKHYSRSDRDSKMAAMNRREEL